MQLADVRPDLRQAYDAAWTKLGEAGSWLTGAERVAIVDESRRARVCELCRARKEALSPFSVQGDHDTAFETPLSEPVIDLVHRVTTDPGRLRPGADGAGRRASVGGQRVLLLNQLTRDPAPGEQEGHRARRHHRRRRQRPAAR